MTAKDPGRWKFSGASRHHDVLWEIMRSDLAPSKRLVLFALEAHVSAAERFTGRCWPAVAALVKATGLGRSTVFQLLGELEAAGWLEVTRRSAEGQTESSVYRVTPPQRQAQLPLGRDAEGSS